MTRTSTIAGTHGASTSATQRVATVAGAALVLTGLLLPAAIASAATTSVERPAAPRMAALSVRQAPATLPTDCSRDVSAELNAWLQALPTTGVRAVLPVNACYRTESTITVRGKSGWVLDGRGAVLRRTQATPAALRYPRNNRHLAVVDSQDVVVQGLQVTGLNTVSDVPKHPEFGRYVRDLEFEHAFSAWNSRRLVLQDLTADAPFGDGVYLHSDVTDVTVLDVDIARNGRQGVGVLASRVLVDGAHLRSSRRAGFDLEPDTRPMSDVEIRNSTVRSHLLAFASGGRGDVDRIHLHHNTITKSGIPFISAARAGHTRNDWTITDNWVQPNLGSPIAAVRLHNARRAVVSRNVIPVVTTQSRKIFDVAAGSEITADCNSFRGALDDPVANRDGTATVRLARSTTGLLPPGCLNTTRVGAPRAAEPVQTSNDWFSAATPVPVLAPGQSSAVYAVDNAGYGSEAFERGTHGTTGRSAWFRYRTGSVPETVTILTTGPLRSVKVVSGSDLFWQVPVAEHYNTQALKVQLAPATTYSIQVDDSTYHKGPRTARSVQLRRS